MEYISRIVDDVIDRKTEAFNAVSITGPKGCGKTRTARERCKTVIEFQDEDKREGYLAVAETAPKLFLKNPKPILFDEWQDAPKIWGTIRKACDDNPESVGEFYLTGSSSKKINTPHTGTGRITDVTLSSYIDALELLYVVKDIDAWTPHLRSKTAIRAAKKHIFVDPSIGLAALGVNPDYFINDLDLLGHVFENMVLRDLLVFAEKHNARVMHYTDDMGVEADAVYQLEDGRYALIEIKTGVNKIPEAEKSLLRFKDIILKYNEKALEKEKHPRDVYKEPSALIVICANATMAYTTESGVRVVPVGCLRD